jgi:hypothetical protein
MVFKSTRIYGVREFYSKNIPLFSPDRPKYLLSSNLSTFDHHRQHIKSRAWGLSDLSLPLGLVLPNGVLVYTPAGYSRLRRGLVTPLEIWSKAFQISSDSLIWSVLSDWAGSALCGAESSRTTLRLGKVPCNAGRTLTGIPRALGPYLISWSNMVVPIPVSSV